jgi:hypothetical protein
MKKKVFINKRIRNNGNRSFFKGKGK